MKQLGQTFDGDIRHVCILQMGPGIYGVVGGPGLLTAQAPGQLPEEIIGQPKNSAVHVSCQETLSDLLEDTSGRGDMNHRGSQKIQRLRGGKAEPAVDPRVLSICAVGSDLPRGDHEDFSLSHGTGLSLGEKGAAAVEDIMKQIVIPDGRTKAVSRGAFFVAVDNGRDVVPSARNDDLFDHTDSSLRLDIFHFTKLFLHFAICKFG